MYVLQSQLTLSDKGDKTYSMYIYSAKMFFKILCYYKLSK